MDGGLDPLEIGSAENFHGDSKVRLAATSQGLDQRSKIEEPKLVCLERIKCKMMTAGA